MKKLSISTVLVGLLWIQALPIANATPGVHCAPHADRALVLSGGGAKGAFEAGAIYHLIIHRECDFRDIAGVSVGALNGAYLAEASTEGNSLANLQARARGLVGFWQGISGPDDVLRKRFLGEVRLFLFGLDSLNDFTRLEHIIDVQVNPTRIRESGRTLRVGVVSFYDGVYHEIEPTESIGDEQFRKYVLASSSIPVNARMPKIPSAFPDGTTREVQYADGGVSHTTPLAAYFSPCDFSPSVLFSPSSTAPSLPPCVSSELTEHRTPIRQLFVIIANPYDPASARLEKKIDQPLRDGKEILARTLDVLTTSPYRWDLNFALAANRMLRWRQQAFAWAQSAVGKDKAQEVLAYMGDGLFEKDAFPVRSANPGPDGFSLPYEMAVISPTKAYADTYGFTPTNIRLQLYKGCVHADQVMTRDFSMTRMRSACATAFPISKEELASEPDPPI